MKPLVVAFLAVAHGVGVFDTEDQLAAGGASLRPVEQGGANHADVRGASRRRAEADANVLREFGFGVFSISHNPLLCRARRTRPVCEPVHLVSLGVILYGFKEGMT